VSLLPLVVIVVSIILHSPSFRIGSLSYSPTLPSHPDSSRSRIEGAPNYRAVPLTLNFSVDKRRASGWVDNGKTVYGTGMPTAEGLRRALKKMDAGPGGKRTVFSTSLRE
jgi:hypothetical protein